VDGECDIVARFADHLLANGVIVQAHGEWKKLQDIYPRYVCTCCNHLYNNKEYKYCPWCGAKMDGLAEREGKG
jgi:rRNA maturation endonuclease Nob1